MANEIKGDETTNTTNVTEIHAVAPFMGYATGFISPGGSPSPLRFTSVLRVTADDAAPADPSHRIDAIFGSGFKDGVGVMGRGGTGLVGFTSDSGGGLDQGNGAGAGVFGLSNEGRGGVFESHKVAQLRLIPTWKNPAQLADAKPTTEFQPKNVEGKLGDLLVTVVERHAGDPFSRVAELWFCNIVDRAGNATWVKVG